jgi:hypothetical protein
MSTASGFEEFDRNNVVYDVETFEVMFQDGLKYNPHTAESLAFLMFKLVTEITSGAEGLEKAINTLKLGVQWVYPYTQAHKMSFRAYLYHLGGLLLVQDYPERVAQRAIDRAEQHLKDTGDDEQSSTDDGADD